MENKALFKTDPGGWIHIVPFGEHPHSCGVIQLIDRKACDAMVSAFEARRVKEGDAFAGVLLDYDHFSLDTNKPSEAAGWIAELSTRDDGHAAVQLPLFAGTRGRGDEKPVVGRGTGGVAGGEAGESGEEKFGSAGVREF